MENQSGSTAFADIMNAHDLTQYLHLSEAKGHRMVKTMCAPAIQVVKSWRFKKEALDERIRQGTGQVSSHPMDLTPAEAPNPLGAQMQKKAA